MLRHAVFLAVCAAARGAEFEYSGFALGQPIEQWQLRFPLAVHDTNAEKHQVWLHRSERAGPVRYAAAETRARVVTALRLSFEREGGGSFEQRHPSCAPELARLTRLYGPPAPPTRTTEERLKNLTYVWRRAGEELSLVCGRYDGRPHAFAMDVLLKLQHRAD